MKNLALSALFILGFSNLSFGMCEKVKDLDGKSLKAELNEDGEVIELGKVQLSVGDKMTVSATEDLLGYLSVLYDGDYDFKDYKNSNGKTFCLLSKTVTTISGSESWLQYIAFEKSLDNKYSMVNIEELEELNEELIDVVSLKFMKEPSQNVNQTNLRIYTEATESKFPLDVQSYVNTLYSTGKHFACNPYAEYQIVNERITEIDGVTYYNANFFVFNEKDQFIRDGVINGRPYREREFSVVKRIDGEVSLYYMSCENVQFIDM